MNEQRALIYADAGASGALIHRKEQAPSPAHARRGASGDSSWGKLPGCYPTDWNCETPWEYKEFYDITD